MNYLLPNHLDAVKIIETKVHLVQDNELIDMLQRYIKHVAVYSALRSSNAAFNPIDIGEPYPEGLPERLKNKTLQLQRQYNDLVGRVTKEHSDVEVN